MKKAILFALLFLCALPVSAETSYMDFVEYAYSWLGSSPDDLWRMTRNEVKERLNNQHAFGCRALFDSSLGKSYYFCRSSSMFSGKYRMRIYFSNSGYLEAIEFRAEDSYIRDLAECYDGQIPTIQTILQNVRDRYGDNGRDLTIENGIFTDSTGRISAQAGIGTNTYVVMGQNVIEHSFDQPAIMFIFCSNNYAAGYARR